MASKRNRLGDTFSIFPTSYVKSFAEDIYNDDPTRGSLFEFGGFRQSSSSHAGVSLVARQQWARSHPVGRVESWPAALPAPVWLLSGFSNGEGAEPTVGGGVHVVREMWGLTREPRGEGGLQPFEMAGR